MKRITFMVTVINLFMVRTNYVLFRLVSLMFVFGDVRKTCYCYRNREH